MNQAKQQNALLKRPPVVVVLGHVDHGKTTLLDYIRKAVAKAAPSGGARSDSETRREPRPVAGREAGGITQSIGAYQIEHNGKKLTFIDTPGHEAFSKMRKRGAKVADIAILVVAVDDGVEPQTKESIGIIKDSKIPFVVAINKVDKEGVDINNVKNELTAAGVLLEGYGGSVSFQPISAKTGQGVNELLDLLLLAAEVEDMPYTPENPVKGIILEAETTSGRGTVATAIVKDGTLRAGDEIVAGKAFGKIKTLENFLGKRVKEALPSDPVLILGFESLPEVGEEFALGARPAETIAAAKSGRPFQGVNELKEGVSQMNLILKADVSGSLEALSEIINNIPKPNSIVIKIIDKSIGDISDGDVKLALSTKAIIVGFRTGLNKAAGNLARIHGINVIASEIVYELVKSLEKRFVLLDKTIIKGDLEILAVFGKQGATQQIIGGRVISGAIENNVGFDIERRESLVGTGKILNLQMGKKDISRLEAGIEGGLLVDSEIVIKAGDHIIIR